MHLAGRRAPPLFVSALLHGDEDTGLRAVQALLSDYAGRELPRALSILVGNVAAARWGVRRLEGQADFNRIWPGAPQGDAPEHAMAREVVEQMGRRGVFASIDIHNNTGLNPHYACVNRLDYRYLHLATLFGRTVVYFTYPRGVQSLAFAELGPAVTLECGRAGEPEGVAHAREYLEAGLRLAAIPDHPVAHSDIDLFHTVAVVKVPDAVSFAFGEAEVDVRFSGDLERLNFQELPAGTTFGWARPGVNAWLHVRDAEGRDRTEHYFRLDGDAIRTRVPVMPSMLAANRRAVRQDCLCYLMERISPQLAAQGPVGG
ncbi:MAG: peptidase M14 [Gammaproteobacteria bacterium]|nr:peptidase M14 [Gammaproteobacteria bacterium]